RKIRPSDFRPSAPPPSALRPSASSRLCVKIRLPSPAPTNLGHKKRKRRRTLKNRLLRLLWPNSTGSEKENDKEERERERPAATGGLTARKHNRAPTPRTPPSARIATPRRDPAPQPANAPPPARPRSRPARRATTPACAAPARPRPCAPS